jgi:hypothetical protein
MEAPSSTKKTHVVLPQDLVREINKIVGSRGLGAQDAPWKRNPLPEDPKAARSRVMAIYLFGTSVIIEALNQRNAGVGGWLHRWVKQATHWLVQ